MSQYVSDLRHPGCLGSPAAGYTLLTKKTTKNTKPAAVNQECQSNLKNF